ETPAPPSAPPPPPPSAPTAVSGAPQLKIRPMAPPLPAGPPPAPAGPQPMIKFTLPMVDTRLIARGPYEANKPVEVVFEISSTDTRNVDVCRVHTPIEGFTGDVLEVTDKSGARARYLGPVVKRGPPSPAGGDFLVLPPKEPMTAAFDLRQVYELKPG